MEYECPTGMFYYLEPISLQGMCFLMSHRSSQPEGLWLCSSDKNLKCFSVHELCDIHVNTLTWLSSDSGLSLRRKLNHYRERKNISFII